MFMNIKNILQDPLHRKVLEVENDAPNASPALVEINETAECNKRKMLNLNSNAPNQVAFDDRTAFAITKNAKSKLKIRIPDAPLVSPFGPLCC